MENWKEIAIEQLERANDFEYLLQKILPHIEKTPYGDRLVAEIEEELKEKNQ